MSRPTAPHPAAPQPGPSGPGQEYVNASAEVAALFRPVMSRYPTGVCIVASVTEAGAPVGMTIGTFTSVSLDPPLVGFLPSKSSASYRQVTQGGRFCVSVLGTDQGPLADTFARTGAEKFAAVDWEPSPSGLPVISGCVAWLDCRLWRTYDGGDHDIVIGEVEALGTSTDHAALIFADRAYCAPEPIQAAHRVPPDLSSYLSLSAYLAPQVCDPHELATHPSPTHPGSTHSIQAQAGTR